MGSESGNLFRAVDVAVLVAAAIVGVEMTRHHLAGLATGHRVDRDDGPAGAGKKSETE